MVIWEVMMWTLRQAHLCSIGETPCSIQDAIPYECQSIDRLAQDNPWEDVPYGGKYCCIPSE